MIGVETYEEHKQTAVRKAPRGLLGILRETRSVRLMTIGASVLSLGKAVQLARADQAVANPNTMVRCALNAQYDPKVCDKTKQQAVDDCERYANLNQSATKSHGQYVRGSHSQYKIGFIPPDPVDCERAGKIKVEVEEQLRNGPTGMFGQNGEAYDFTAPGIDYHGHPHHMDVTLDAPYDCATLIPGSVVVRPFIKMDFVPTPGWSNRNSYVYTVQGPAQPIC